MGEPNRILLPQVGLRMGKHLWRVGRLITERNTAASRHGTQITKSGVRNHCNAINKVFLVNSQGIPCQNNESWVSTS